GLPITELSADEAILHALNRLAYGPRPGDIERVRQMGLAKWIDQQLNPNSIDDKAVEARLDAYPTLRMSSKQLLADYPQPKQAGKKAEKQPQAQTRGDAAAAIVAEDMRTNPANAIEPSNAADVSASASPMKQQSAPQIEANPPTPGAGGGGKRGSLSVDPNAVPRAIADNSRKPQRVVEELAMAKVTRAVYSERQLQQVMDDFWFNHFNVFAGKGDVKWLMTSYERDVIQPHTLGTFKDLLDATAHSPAMLFYLDNYLSVDPNAAARAAAQRAARQQARWGRFGGPPPRPQQAAKKGTRGLNENYGRELMELHTLSVNGGYSQRDVTEVAKVFTGWTIEQPYQNPSFKFDPRMHEPGPKFVLGHKIKPGGETEGLRVLHMLATSPQTAHFISLKLAERFVSDDPPPALVDRMAKTFLKKKGDIREVLTVLFRSPEFWSDHAYRAKVKTPLEFVASAVRATGADVTDALPLARQLGNLGMPLYGVQPPTGYSMKAETWVSSSSLLTRMNFALRLTSGRMPGVTLDSEQLRGREPPADSAAALSALENSLLAGNVSQQTHDSIVAQIESTEKNGAPAKQDNKVAVRKPEESPGSAEVATIAGLLLGSPEFQRR
ncbi:MAG TPA: DUF1800 family protein, partial [Candidatus Aquilonibacter sp.]|nr:DUF1800 family protein [Candidatus Aquilonibacter sp.]